MPEPTPTPPVIAILDTDTTVPSIQHSHGKYYSAAYIHHLTAAATAASIPVPTFTTHNVLEDNTYPDPAAVSAILITGSIAAAYDTHPWVLRLAAFIADVYANHPHVRIFGTCFGHQLIGQVLLGPHGAVVEKDPAGYEFGVQTIALHPRLVAEYPCLRGLAQVNNEQKDVRGLRLQMCHGDHVALPATLPGSWLNIGGSAQCAVQGLYEPSRVLTIQPHFEGDQVMMEETIKHFYTPEKGFSPEFLEKAFEGTRRQDDAGVAAEWVLRFLLGIS